MDRKGISIKGIYRDILKGPHGDIIYDSGWTSNAIVDRCRILMTGFMKNDPAVPIEGIEYLAVGQGLKAWDTTGAPAPDPAAMTDLVNRYTPTIPLADLDLAYLDGNEFEDPGPTSRLQITATLKPDYPAPIAPLTSFPLREFGLFGRFGGNDYMIDVIRHPVIHKDKSATLIRVVRLYF